MTNAINSFVTTNSMLYDQDYEIDTVHIILLCYLGDDIRCAVSADLKMVARNRPLILSNINCYILCIWLLRHFEH